MVDHKPLGLARPHVTANRRLDHWEDFAENAPLGLQSVGPDGRILWVNQAQLDLLGYSREQVVGSHLGSFHADGLMVD